VTTLDDYARQSAYSDPRAHATLFDAVPAGLPAVAAVCRNLIVHYRADGAELSPDRLAEIDHRWVDRILDTDQARFGTALTEPRPKADRVAGCCRDFALLAVAMLRHAGVPARSRVGFVNYFEPGWHNDHVIVDVRAGDRWISADPELDPSGDLPFDPLDIPVHLGADGPLDQPYLSAARVWTGYRRGELDVEKFGVTPGHPASGGWFVRNYVLIELAHRQRDELLLWDGWGAASDTLDGDLGLIDEIAALMLAADAGDEEADRQLSDRYAADPRLSPGTHVLSFSPAGDGAPRRIPLAR
jgi:hypothetical protein